MHTYSLWGFAYGLLDTLNAKFQDALGISAAEAAGLQAGMYYYYYYCMEGGCSGWGGGLILDAIAYFGAYFVGE